MANGTAPARALMIMHEKDNVAVCLRPVTAGEALEASHGGKRIALTIPEEVPLGHKVALSAIAASQPIVKYGEIIGRATRDIGPGQHVHDHNISDF
jgi:hypothetical protein